MKLVRRSTFNRIKMRLGRLYGRNLADQLSERLYMLVGRYGVLPDEAQVNRAKDPKWSESDAVLITYGDMVRKKGEAPLETLKQFCDRRLRGAINCVHVLPFFPSSSDGGFSVVDFWSVDPGLGTWHDIERLGGDYSLMVDLVLNHCSRKSDWFRSYVSGIAPQSQYFIEADPNGDYSQVVRPRPWPLLSRTETARGTAHVWTTFSEDQVDLNWKSPDVLFEFLDILLYYISKGARIIRLDAVAFLWKNDGTNCIHLPETHEVVRLLRDFLITAAPHVVLLTETNVPHEENVSYFGRGDEAHMVYQFALPPLLLHGLLRGNAGTLRRWAASLEPPPKGCTFLNFTASHDGIGVRPLEGLVPTSEVDWLVEEVRGRGAAVGERSMPDGSRRPYELNITYRDALSDSSDAELGMRRFICSQAVVLALQGVPAVYFHSLVGERNWEEGPAREGGEKRDINRRRWEWSDLNDRLDDPESSHAWIHRIYVTLLRIRSQCSAFHPDAPQQVLETGDELFAILRSSLDGRVRVVCCFNFTAAPITVPEELLEMQLPGASIFRNLLDGAEVSAEAGGWLLRPYECAWVIAE